MNNNLSTLNPSETASALSALLDASIPVMIWGSPGVGKSQIVAQVAQSRGIDTQDIRLSQLDPTDLRGLPMVRDNIASWAQPDFLPVSGNGILFLDELNSAPALVQAAAYQLILDRRLGNYILPDGWLIVAAGNKETDRAIVNRMPSALANRLAHIEMVPEIKSWSRWALKNGVHPLVISFLRFRPELLFAFSPQAGEKAFSSPRSWEFASKVWSAGIPEAVEFQVLAGLVGQASAIEFTGFSRIFKQLPSIDGILTNPMGATVPTSPDALFALSGALAARATSDNFDRVYSYAKRMGSEFCVATVLDAVTRDKELTATSAFTRFGVEFQDACL